MSEVPAGRGETFLRTAGRDGFAAEQALLLYGPNGGLVRERARAAVAAALGGAGDDPFRLARLEPALLGDKRRGLSRLLDEADTAAFGGGRRVLWLEAGAEKCAAALSGYLAELDRGRLPAAPLLIAEGGDLPKRHALVRAFSASGRARVLACYEDDEAARAAVLEAALPAGALDEEVLRLALHRLPGDRMAARMEAQKLALFAGSPGGAGGAGGADGADGAGAASAPVSAEEVRLLLAGEAESGLDELAFALAGRDFPAAARALEQARENKVAPVALLRAGGRHLRRLHAVAAAADPEQAMAALRPPVFWKRKSQFRAQAKGWSEPALAAAAARLYAAELAVKRASSGPAGRIQAERALLSLAGPSRPRSG